MTDTIIVILYIIIGIPLYILLKKLFRYINDIKKEDYLVSDRNAMLFFTIVWPVSLPLLLLVSIAEWNERNKNKPSKW